MVTLTSLFSAPLYFLNDKIKQQKTNKQKCFWFPSLSFFVILTFFSLSVSINFSSKHFKILWDAPLYNKTLPRFRTLWECYSPELNSRWPSANHLACQCSCQSFQPLVKAHSLLSLMPAGYTILFPFLVDVIYWFLNHFPSLLKVFDNFWGRIHNCPLYLISC